MGKMEHLLFDGTDLTPEKATRLTQEALAGCDDGELFLEYGRSEAFSWDDGCLKSTSYNASHGFGLRGVAGEAFGYAHSDDVSEAAIKRAAETVRDVRKGYSGTLGEAPRNTNRHLYTPDNPLDPVPFTDKVKLLTDMDAYARGKDERVKQVSAGLSGSWRVVQIVRAEGTRVTDIRPLVRLNVSVVVEKDGRMETGGYGCGGRVDYAAFLSPENWQSAVDEALRRALVNLEAAPAPAGEMTVVLGSGWPGVMLHEAIGHGLEGDFNRKKTSAFAGLLGEKIAADHVTVVDDGTITDRRGSLTVDDEGTPTQCTTLIENGRLVGYMQDRMNARLMGVDPTGNGRRQSYAHAPMPRMTNTIMLGGTHSVEEIIASVPNGLYAVDFGGGQVDITSGKFVFSASEAYVIENGKVGRPVKGATLIGNGPDALTRVGMVANDMKMDPGIGTCGKNGQGVPVGVGQPTLRINGLTVGGTSL